jgi:hypothetical protein
LTYRVDYGFILVRPNDIANSTRVDQSDPVRIRFGYEAKVE